MNKRDLDTPHVLIDLDAVERNIARMQDIADRAEVSLRPHAKTHKLPVLAHKQIEAGAVGVTVAKLGEAEVMAAGGVRDILIAYPIVGEQKLERLIRLAKHVDITVAVDGYEVAEAISDAALEANMTIGVLVEFDCGFRRVGLEAGEPVLELAMRLVQLPGIEIKGIMTFGGQAYQAADESELRRLGREEGQAAADTAQQLIEQGIAADIVSAGSSPGSPYTANVQGVTEIRPGTYIFGDLMQVALGAQSLEDCALTVKVTVVSRPEPGRAVIDAGTKIFTSDGAASPIGTGKGYVVGHPGINLAWMSEEHGMLELDESEQSLAIGDTLEIIPVHCCAVMNMVDEVAAIRGEEVEALWEVQGRGKSR
ncbi:D-serine deaminase-like pyridoxal phosphate-dependent protein [Paenibacillus taihuensis]|uniref:D-serine deaminase-like pyridoxal phosphate-dependent protein n=1 Tax=Paenibacillus taihuensis TaxID=1156355 RepID=A0A3D9QVX7_9BACL|nr:alanine racemase [Paenibacillus taihuensis]REE68802.1 D-serine deaminase-like pyridoxal phosphate-dependent protein [Paenibacillus taihuensis]